MAMRRTFVLGIEGFPLTLLQRLAADGTLPRTARLLEQGVLQPLDAGVPVEPICAWTTFGTGVNPGEHNVHGFVDRNVVSWETQVASARRRAAEALWDRLSRLGGEVCVINVPGTYPPRPIEGVLVAGFPAPRLEGVSAEADVVARLSAEGYRIDVDGRLVVGERGPLVDSVVQVLDRRETALAALLGLKRWDYVHVHVSAIDRLHRAAWSVWDQDDPEAIAEIEPAYRRLDDFVGRFASYAGEDCDLIVVSDFGFAPIRGELQLNRWLEESGYLAVAEPRDPRRLLQGLDLPATRAYSIAPGRVYLNLQGRESGGVVPQGAEAEALLDEITGGLLALRSEDGAAPVVERVLRGAEVFSGGAANLAPDLVVEPHAGYVLRGTVACDAMWQRTPLEGTHVRGGGFHFARGGGADVDDGVMTMERAHADVQRRLGVA